MSGALAALAVLLAPLHAAFDGALEPNGVPHPVLHEGQLADTFASAAELGVWRDYLYGTYGKSLTFPFSLAELNFFNLERLPRAVRQTLKLRAGALGNCRRENWQDVDGFGKLKRHDLYLLFRRNFLFRCTLDVCSWGLSNDTCTRSGFVGAGCTPGYDEAGAVEATMQDYVASTATFGRATAASGAIYVPREGYPSNSLAEVIHHGSDGGQRGYWMYYAPGSGVYLNLSRTIAFETHAAAVDHFCSGDQACTAQGERGLVRAAQRAGYDTVQFTRFVEYSMVKSEIVLVREEAVEDEQAAGERRGGCLPLRGMHLLRGGWRGVHACSCDPHEDTVNCRGVAAST
jgi:hypothetical protein